MTKKFDLFHLNGHMYAVDKEADIIANVTPVFNEVVPFSPGSPCSVNLSKSKPYSEDGKINLFKGIHALIASTEVLDNVLLLRSYEVDVEQMATDKFNKFGYKTGKIDFTVGYISGYNAATKVYTQEDLKRAVNMVLNSTFTSIDHAMGIIKEKFNSEIPKTVAVELEVEDYNPYTKKVVDKMKGVSFIIKPKLIDNQVVVNKWIYE